MDILNTQCLIRHGHLNLFSTAYRDRKGDDKAWVFASRCNSPKLVTGDFHRPDAVVIAAMHTAREAVVVIEEYRITLGGYQYGFPAGLVDEGESVEAAATRELKEETGLDLVRVLKTSPPIYSSSGMTDESVSMVFCECEGDPSNSGNEASEDIHVKFVNRNDVNALCNNPNGKTDAKAWLVLYGFGLTGVFGG